MNKLKISFAMMAAALSFPFCAQALTDAGLMAARDGFEARRDGALATLAGQPFRPAKKNPPLGAGRPAYVRGYAWSVTSYAMKTFLLGEDPAAANAALIEMFNYFSENRDVRNDFDNFYWSMDVVCRLVEYYGRNGSRAAGRLSPAAEDAALKMMFLWVKEQSRLVDADLKNPGAPVPAGIPPKAGTPQPAPPRAVKSGTPKPDPTWIVWGSENHHLMRFSTCWHFSKLLMDRAEYRDRPYDDGATARAHHDAWAAYAKEYLAERARKSLFIEIANDGYNTESLKGICNLHEFAADGELRRRAGLFLDLYWACWAQEQLGGVRGGGKTRIYPGSSSTQGLSQGIATLAWYYFGLGRATTPEGADFTFLTCPWRPPLVVMDLALDPAGRGEYEIRQWPLGLALEGYDNFPEYHMRTDLGGIQRYTWCTPDFIMGTLMFEARSATDWAAISNQNRWQGVVFAGDPDARIFPQVRALSRNRAYNQHWSVQSKGTLITQKLKTSKGAGEMRVWFSGKGVRTIGETGGWAFAEAAGAWAAVRPARGAFAWQEAEGAGQRGGRWLVPEDPYAPVIIEAARKSEFKEVEAFKNKVLGNPLSFEKSVLRYTGVGGDRFEFFADFSQPPRINGKAADLAPRASFESPFVQSARDSGVVTIQKGDRRVVLDFNKP